MKNLCFTTLFEDESGRRFKIWTRKPLLGLARWRRQRKSGKPVKIVGLTKAEA